MIESDVVVTSDGRTVTVGYWLSENVERRKKAEARLAAVEALCDEAEAESGRKLGTWIATSDVRARLTTDSAATDLAVENEQLPKDER